MNLKTYILFVFCLLFCSCEKDFDELTDGKQREITFVFRDIGEAAFMKGAEGSRIRIAGYCYNNAGELVTSQTLLTTLDKQETMRMQHLTKDENYRFVFLADVVEYDSQVGYFETWYQLGTDRWKTFYLYANQRHNDPMYDAVAMSDFRSTPTNQTVEVEFSPITCTGYCTFTNIADIEQIYVEAYATFHLDGLKGIETDWIDKLNQSDLKEGMVRPYSLTYADDNLFVYLLSPTDTTTITIANPEHTSFKATIDCGKREIVND